MNNKRAKRTYNQRTKKKVDTMEIPNRTSLSQYDGSNPQHQIPDYKGTLTNPDLAT